MLLRDWVLALLVVVAWGFNFVVIRWGLDGVPPMLLGALRFLLVAFPALLFVRRPQLPLRWLFGYGITISFGQFALLFGGMHLGMPAGLASLVLQAQVLFTLLFAALLLKEPPRAEQWICIGVASAGLLLLALQGNNAGGATMTLVGFLLTIGAAASWGLGNIINRHIGSMGGVNLMGLVVWGALIPPLPFMALSLWLEGPAQVKETLLNLSGQSMLVLLYLAVVATLFGYRVWGGLLTRYSPGVVAPLTLLVPVTGLLFADLLLDEKLTPLQWAGIALVMLGLVINLLGGRWRQRATLGQRRLAP
ncbi:EamA family transporter [Aestuariirhabdus litorea]|uniref:O-acetylserine/cysteine exporter n=1 Tax=Aestuariirhabdus litorea TaxID=2528527 RepID=A0A3P3VNM8_9GAMM|nr:EamA family transporter [Aestuariirhabdus litorea]RRJ84361.1 O-acetylserine/cysteine exporter [Aestuariirhabdus litorea]RWW97584.1 O-acetylserine/cysteine exporter [Endozoicomonadaceae bacterium GTF-13]